MMGPRPVEGGSSVGRRLAIAVAGVLAIVVWGVAIMLGLTGMTHYQPDAGTVSVSDRGTARVVDCVSEGPVSLNGIGSWWVCRADVTWEDGTEERKEAQPGQLTPDDRGQDVAVVERIVASKGGPGTPQVYRADFEPSVVFGLGSLLAGLGVGGLFAIIIFGSTLSRLDARRKDQPQR